VPRVLKDKEDPKELREQSELREQPELKVVEDQ
jgi:hypothetical protein